MTHHHGTSRIVALSFLAVFFAGCQTDLTKAPASGRMDMLQLKDYPQIAVQPTLDEALVFATAVVDPSTADRPMHVRVPVRSIHDTGGLNIQYRFEFLDNRNLSLRTNSGWRFLHLTPRIQTDLEGAALETKASDWRLEVRAAK